MQLQRGRYLAELRRIAESCFIGHHEPKQSQQSSPMRILRGAATVALAVTAMVTARSIITVAGIVTSIVAATATDTIKVAVIVIAIVTVIAIVMVSVLV